MIEPIIDSILGSDVERAAPNRGGHLEGTMKKRGEAKQRLITLDVAALVTVKGGGTSVRPCDLTLAPPGKWIIIFPE
jgi:hypothetical protein